MTATSKSRSIVKKQIAQTLRHELRHADQFYNQGQNFAEGKSLMTPGSICTIPVMKQWSIPI